MKPELGDKVHYVSYGTPRGEFPSTCRLAFVAQVGDWIEKDEDSPGDGRISYQELDEEACVLFVVNPSGLFFNTCQHDENQAPGTWHWPERTDGE